MKNGEMMDGNKLFKIAAAESEDRWPLLCVRYPDVLDVNLH